MSGLTQEERAAEVNRILATLQREPSIAFTVWCQAAWTMKLLTLEDLEIHTARQNVRPPGHATIAMLRTMLARAENMQWEKMPE